MTSKGFKSEHWAWVIFDYSSKDYLRISDPTLQSLLNYHIYSRVRNVLPYPDVEVYRGYMEFIEPKSFQEVRDLVGGTYRLYLNPCTSFATIDSLIDMVYGGDDSACVVYLNPNTSTAERCQCCPIHLNKKRKYK